MQPVVDGGPRRHHYEFAHRALPDILLNPRVDAEALARAGRLDGALRATWEAVGEHHQSADRVPADGLGAELVRVGGETGLLVTLPTPRHVPEAFFALVAPLTPPQARRYFVLELSKNPATGAPETVMGEWRGQNHLNLGEGPAPAPSAFLAQAQQLLDASEAPET